ncbi:cytochrome P450 [Xylariomycetidae sp. FL2044]|nr:cytochrome P450 [Xylariomycetidae sp. FL2044]
MAVLSLLMSVAKYIALLCLPYLISLVAYRVFFHPLRKFPGPFLAKLSDAYPGFYALSMRLHLRTFQDQKKYGPVIRHGPNKLIFNSAQALQDIYNNERVTKSTCVLVTVSNNKPSLFSLLGQQEHRARRKVVGQAINEKSSRAFEPVIMEQINVFIDILLEASRTSTPVNMTKRCKRLGMDVVGLLAFGQHLNLQTDPKNRFLLRGLAVGTHQGNSAMQFPLLNKLKPILLLGYGQRMKYLRMLQEMIATRMSEEKHSRTDFYSFIIDHIDEASGGLTVNGLWSEALFLFPAAGDTTTTTMSALFFYLSRNPNVYSKLADEIRSTFETEGEIRSGSKLASCRYLRACIDETLRMSPPATGTLWRELYPDQKARGPFVVDGTVVPPGTQVGVCIYSLHHNEEYFPEPFVFRPERWLDQDTLSRSYSAFAAFSVGARGCAGKPMAYLEASLVMAKTLWHFDFAVAPGKLGELGAGVPGKTNGRHRPSEFQLFDTFGSRHDGPNLVFKSRHDAQ